MASLNTYAVQNSVRQIQKMWRTHRITPAAGMHSGEFLTEAMRSVSRSTQKPPPHCIAYTVIWFCLIGSIGLSPLKKKRRLGVERAMANRLLGRSQTYQGEAVAIRDSQFVSAWCAHVRVDAACPRPGHVLNSPLPPSLSGASSVPS